MKQPTFANGLMASLFIAGGCGTTANETPTKPTNPRAAADSPALLAPNEPPSLEIPAFKTVGVGQEISFGLEVVDADQDSFKVELIGKPASARFDPYTLTVVWEPRASDAPRGDFAVRITELGSTVRQYQHRFSIDVSSARQSLPIAQPLGPVVENVLTIHDAQRLKEVNRKWPLDRMLSHAATLYTSTMSADKRASLSKPTSAALYRTVLKNFALANKNPIVDPDAPEFSKAGFGNPKDWKIIAVRPRLDKKWQELRIVYKAPAHEDAYLMFKFRPARADAKKETERIANNKAFSALVWDAFLDDEGHIKKSHVKNAQAHGKAVARFFDRLLTAKGATFLGIPSEARLGGGSVRRDDGTVESGDGWSWHVQKVKAKGETIQFVNVPIKGFATHVVPTSDGTAWAMACSKRFARDKRMKPLCRPSGHVDLPASGQGYSDGETAKGAITSSLVDATTLFKRYKSRWMVEQIALDDPRRDVFEEKGMTCSQCHVRNFGVRDMYDRSAYDPRAGIPSRKNKKQATTYFVITPTETWQPYAIDFQHKQECKARDALARYLGKTPKGLGCPLKEE